MPVSAYAVGTGFLVSEDGWILTAAHVLRDASGNDVPSVWVHLPNGATALATNVLPPDARKQVELAIQDIGLLKVDGKALPFMPLGTHNDVESGSDVAVIGFPFSAELGRGHVNIESVPRFCLSGSIAATELASYQGVQSEVIYFQGVSIKGLSGSPIVSRETGRVVGRLGFVAD